MKLEIIYKDEKKTMLLNTRYLFWHVVAVSDEVKFSNIHQDHISQHNCNTASNYVQNSY